MKSKVPFSIATVFVSLLLPLAACKTGSNLAEKGDSDILSTDGSYDPVVIVLGGFWSCGSKTTSKNKDEWSPTETAVSAASMIGIATRQLSEVKKAIKSDVGHLLSCYTPDIDMTKINFINQVNDNKGVVRADLDEMINSLNTSLEKLNNPRVSIVGHSYGGWTAMKLALKLTPKATLSTLVTIDPISRERCTPRNFLANMDAKITSGTGCHESPKDFSSQDIDTIAKRANGSWYNYYQTSAKYLHSSSIGSKSLKVDTQVNFVTKDDMVEAHNSFLRDDSFIEKITQTVVQNLKQ
jgi:hypothetical protein